MQRGWYPWIPALSDCRPDPATTVRSAMEMPLYRLIDRHAQLLEHKCVTFADGLLYQDLLQRDSKE